MVSDPPSYEKVLPRYSTSDPSWMKEAALRILQTSHDFNTIRLVCRFVPGLDPADATTLLSKRWKGWLVAFLKDLWRREGIQEPPDDSVLSIAKAIVAIIRRRPLVPAEQPAVEIQSMDTTAVAEILEAQDTVVIAEKLDAQIHSMFSRITFEDWLAWFYGSSNDTIQSLLNTVFKLRDDLIRFVEQGSITADKLVLLQKVLPSQQPLLCWIVSTAIASDTSSDPYEALWFFLDPIRQRVTEQSSGVLSVVQKFSILDTRYKLHIASATDVKWPEPFSIDFSFWESVQNNTPWELAKSNTESVGRLFARLAPADVLEDSEYLKGLQRQWSDLAVDVYACLIIGESWTVYFIQLAECFLDLRNVHSAAAIGLALEMYCYCPPQNTKHSRAWDIINPQDNYASCQKFMAKMPCLPFLFPYVRALRRSRNGAGELIALFQYLGCLGRQEEVEQEGARRGVRDGTIVDRNSLSQVPPTSLVRQPTRNAMQHISPKDSQRNGMNIKRRRIHNDGRKNVLPKDDEGSTLETIHIAFREKYADEVQTLKIRKNCQIFQEAYQQMARILRGIADAPTVALEILSCLNRTQTVLVSCATIVTEQHCSNPKDWTSEERSAFSRKYTASVAGSWHEEEILNDWEGLAKALFDEAQLRRSGKELATRGN